MRESNPGRLDGNPARNLLDWFILKTSCFTFKKKVKEKVHNCLNVIFFDTPIDKAIYFIAKINAMEEGHFQSCFELTVLQRQTRLPAFFTSRLALLCNTSFFA